MAKRLKATNNGDDMPPNTDLREGDSNAEQAFWALYFPRVAQLVRKKLPAHLRRAFDEEDVALSAIKSFLRGIREGRFPTGMTDNDIWNLLAVISMRKAMAYVRRETREKRGGGKIAGQSGLAAPGAESAGFEHFAGRDVDPQLAAEVSDEWLRMIEGLPGDEFRSIALMRVQGFSVANIASRLGCTHRRVERRLQIIRQNWTAQMQKPNSSADRSE